MKRSTKNIIIAGIFTITATIIEGLFDLYNSNKNNTTTDVTTTDVTTTDVNVNDVNVNDVIKIPIVDDITTTDTDDNIEKSINVNVK